MALAGGSDPGSQVFNVHKGRVGNKPPHGTHYAEATIGMNSQGGDTPMQVFNASETDVETFEIFLLDATRPAKLE